MDKEPWDHDSDDLWEGQDSEPWGTPDTEAWRGEIHMDDWPEDMAGPEYWLYRQDEEEQP